MRHWWGRVKRKMAALLAYFLARCIGMTLRIEVRGQERFDAESTGRILAGWHGRTMLAALKYRNRKWWALISHSRDGEIQNTIFNLLGFRVVRGSTGRGGARAAIECARILRQGETFVFTPDGPRGPSQKVQRGILWLAQKGSATIFPAAASAKPRKLFNSWDRYLVPFPFAKGLILIGEPIRVPPNANENDLQQIGERLEHQLNQLQTQAERELGFDA